MKSVFKRFLGWLRSPKNRKSSQNHVVLHGNKVLLKPEKRDSGSYFGSFLTSFWTLEATFSEKGGSENDGKTSVTNSHAGKKKRMQVHANPCE